jgi:hypothetical protein
MGVQGSDGSEFINDVKLFRLNPKTQQYQLYNLTEDPAFPEKRSC